MSEIVLVTAFFDIGRSREKIMPRSTEKYFRDFAFWARMQNHLIVFTSEKFKDRILKIRNRYGRSGCTHIIVIDNIWEIEPNIFQKMQKVENNPSFLKWRQRPESSDNQAKYNYVTMMKFYFMAQAAKMADKNDTIAWIDFGYNHGGQVYVEPKEFDFKWEYNFGDKITLFAFKDTWKTSIFGAAVLQSMTAVLSAGIMPVPAMLCAKYYEMIKKAMEALLMIDCMDDDQMLMLMAYRQEPNLFQIKLHSGWHRALKEYGGKHLTVRKKVIQKTDVHNRLAAVMKSGDIWFRIDNYLIRKRLEKASDKIYWARLEKLISEYHEV